MQSAGAGCRSGLALVLSPRWEWHPLAVWFRVAPNRFCYHVVNVRFSLDLLGIGAGDGERFHDGVAGTLEETGPAEVVEPEGREGSDGS